MEQALLHIKIEGRVQGVFYRQSAVEEARKLGLLGWVRNRRDGSVEVLAKGEASALAQMLAWCRQGPEAAEVSAVEEILDLSAKDLPEIGAGLFRKEVTI